MTTMAIFANDAETESYPAGHRFFTAGDHGDMMYVLTEGSAAISVRGTLVETVEPGGMFGEMALIDHRERSADVTAKTDVKVTPINQKRFLYLIANHPFFAIQVMTIMAERLRRTDAKL